MGRAVEVAVRLVVPVPAEGQRQPAVEVVPPRLEPGARRGIVHLPVHEHLDTAHLVHDVGQAREAGDHVPLDR